MPGFEPGDADFLSIPQVQKDIAALIQGGEKPEVAQRNVLKGYRKRWTDSKKEARVSGTPSQIRKMGGSKTTGRTPEDYHAGRAGASTSDGLGNNEDQIAQMEKMADLAAKHRKVVKKEMDYAQFHQLVRKGVDPNIAAQMSQRTTQIPQEMADLEARVGKVAARNIMATRERKGGMDVDAREADIIRRKADMRAAMGHRAQPGQQGTGEGLMLDDVSPIVNEGLDGPGGQSISPFIVDGPGNVGQEWPYRGERMVSGPQIDRMFADEEAEIASMRKKETELAAAPTQPAGVATPPPTSETKAAATASYNVLSKRNLLTKADASPGITGPELIKTDVISKMEESPGLINNINHLNDLWAADTSTKNYDFLNNLQLDGMKQTDGAPGHLVSRLMNAPYFRKLSEDFNVIEFGAIKQWFGGRSAVSKTQYNNAVNAIKKAVENAVNDGHLPTTIRKAWRGAGDIQNALKDDWSTTEINEFESELEHWIRKFTEQKYGLVAKPEYANATQSKSNKKKVAYTPKERTRLSNRSTQV